MGGIVSQIWWGGDPNGANPVSGLTRRQVYAVQKSWAPVFANNIAVGTELLKRYFRAYPEAKKYFRMIQNLSEDEYDTNIQFKAHVVSLMNALNLAVVNLYQPELVAALMQKLGDSHAKRKIQEKDFYDLRVVLGKMFMDVLKLDDPTLSAWGSTLDFWYKNIFQTLSTTNTQS